MERSFHQIINSVISVEKTYEYTTASFVEASAKNDKNIDESFKVLTELTFEKIGNFEFN